MGLRSSQLLALSIYRVTLSLVYPLGALLFLPVLLLIRKRRRTLFSRFGWQTYPHAHNHDAGPVWVHALSVGEVLSAVNLVTRTHAALKDRPLYVSVSTFSGFTIAQEKLGQYVDGLFYFPYDVVFAVRRCLDQVRPGLFILVETDIWPGFLAEVRRRRIPALLVNGRLSPQSFRSYRFLRPLFAAAFNTFRWIYPQSQREADRFLALGVESEKIRRSGNLKFDVADSLAASEAIQSMRESLRLDTNSLVFVAGSTHPGEEVIIRSVFLKLRDSHSNLTLIIAPRHPERSHEVCNLFGSDPFEVDLFSRVRRPDAAVLVVDRIGYLSRLYALADIAFVGGSLVPKGGHNPIEPACYGKPILFGSDMRNFPDVSEWLLEGGGAIRVNNEDDLFRESKRLLADRQLAHTVGQKAARVVEQNRGATERIVEDVVKFLENSAR
ncbi:MAG: 3-deoxy-D-manno-octulosonic acid transferase [Nitrospiraceae bacterium]